MFLGILWNLNGDGHLYITCFTVVNHHIMFSTQQYNTMCCLQGKENCLHSWCYYVILESLLRTVFQNHSCLQTTQIPLYSSFGTWMENTGWISLCDLVNLLHLLIKRWVFVISNNFRHNRHIRQILVWPKCPGGVEDRLPGKNSGHYKHCDYE